MSCTINGNTVESGITDFLDKELSSSDLFDKENSVYISRPAQYFAAQEFVKGINTKFSADVIKKLSDRRFDIRIPEGVLQDYLKSTQEGKDLYTLVGLYGDFAVAPNSWNNEETFTALSYPEINEFTYNKLVTFVKSLNPAFNVQEIDNLSEEGMTSLKDFFIAVRTLSKFKAMPEETAHAFRMLIPDSNPLKQEMFNNINNFPIYSQTLARYKDVYRKEDGTPDYDKIKWEAADKLVAEYVTAIATDNHERVNALTEVKQGWLKRWLYKILEWLGFAMRDNTRSYADIAGIILSGKTDITLKDAKDVEDMSYTNSYFYRLSESELYEHAAEVVNKKPPELLENVDRFSREFGRRFNEILKDEKYKELNEMLKRSGDTIGKINKLSEIQIILGESKMDLRAALDSNAYLTGVKQFLEAIDRLDILADSILKVINNKAKVETFNQAIENIQELETYFGLYETFKNMISADFVKIMIESEVSPEIVKWLQSTQTAFEAVNSYILSKQRHNFFIFYKGLLNESNNTSITTLDKDIENAKKLGNQDAVKMFQKQKDKLVTTDEDIIKMLSGKGRDIDSMSSINHMLNAARANGDVFLSSIALYIQRRIEAQQLKSQPVVRDLYQRIDPLQKKIGESSEATGKKITQVEEIWDADLNEEREVLMWMNPHKGIQLAIAKLRTTVKDLSRERYKADKNSPEFKDLDNRFKDAVKARDAFYEKYMYRPFVDAYYNTRKKYEDDTDFINVMVEWQNLSELVRDKETYLYYEPENEEVANELARVKRIRANLLSELTEEGEAKSEHEIREAQILKKFFDESSSFNEDDEVQTERAYETARNRYEQRADIAIGITEGKSFTDIQEVERSIQDLMKNPRIRITSVYIQAFPDEDAKIDYKFIKDTIMEKWDSKNTTVVRNQKFFDDEAELRKQLDDLQRKGELTDSEKQMLADYEAVRGILWGSKDQSGHVNPESLMRIYKDEDNNVIEDRSLLDKLIRLEESIAEHKMDRPGYGVFLEDFTPEDLQTYNDLSATINNPASPTQSKRLAIIKKNRLTNKYKDKGKAKAIKDLINLLGSMTTKEPTSYYWDKMLTFIPHIAEFQRFSRTLGLTKEQEDGIKDFTNEFIAAIDTEDWDTLDFMVYENTYMDPFLLWLQGNKSDFFDWFADNHSEKKVFDPQNGYYTKLKYARSTVYTYKSPTADEHRDIKKSRKYIRKRVKDEFRTGYNPQTKKVELVVGKHISNREYNGFPEFLPLLREDGAPDNSPYHNQAYYDLRDNDPTRFEYLNTLRDAHIQHQDKLPARLRTWNQVPVMHLSEIEEIQKIPDVAKSKWDRLKSVFKKNTAGDAEAQTEGEDTSEEIDQFTQTTIKDRIPKLGMSQKVPIERVSRDLTKATAQFIIRAHEFEGRSKAEPIVKTLNRIMRDNAFKGYLSNKERAKKFEALYSQMILQEVPEGTLNNRTVRRVAKWITGTTALRMLADPIGGIINYSSAMVNDIIEAAAGKYLNFNDLWKGKMLSFQVNAALMADYNKKANLSLYTIMFQTFEFIQGEFEEDLLDRSSSKDKHASIQQMLMIPRKSGELMAQTAVGMGILSRTKVLNSIDGKKYSVHEIYKVKDNNLVLKEGFPQEWNPVDGEKFIKIRELIHRINYELHGNYAKLTQSDASRYAIGKLAENMKRWFMPAFQRRFGRESNDITFEDLNEGYYRTTANAAQKIFGSLIHMDFGQAKSWANIFFKTPRYQQNLRRMGAEIAQAVMLLFIFSTLLGYSGDDKNKELNNNSWIHNTAILIMLRVYSETTAYVPFPPFGFQEMKRNVLTPFSLPSDAISNFAALGQLGLYQVLYWMGADGLHNNLYYSKDAGYWYSEKGDKKFWKYFLNSIGHSGYTINPDQYVRQFSNIQARLK